MSSFVPRHADTLADRTRYTSEGLTTVECMDCLATVRVRKNSDQQTAIQWPADAQRMCPELSKDEGFERGCPRLRASIEAAVRDGRLPIGAGE
jgi:hypothetical protein